MTRVLALLIRPWGPPAAALTGVVLALPALGGGIFGDDYMHRSILLGVGDVARGTNPMLDLFNFVPRGARRLATVELGTLTWWAHPDINLALLRPLSALTHVIDYSLWPDFFALQHLHSLLWYGLAVFAVAGFYRRVHGSTAVAGVAAMLFAVDEAHAMCAGWLANRHALVAMVFGVAAAHAHHRWRCQGGRKWAWLAVSALAAGILASEAALGAAAYIAAWELVMEDRPLVRRLAALLPYALLVAAWRVGYDALGYGGDGTGLYIDPGRHPVDFLAALAQRWPILQTALWFQVPVDFSLLLPRELHRALVVISVIACVALAWAFAPLLAARREARFWATGMALGLVPLCAAFPMDRLLLFSGVGGFALLSLLVENSRRRAADPAGAAVPRRRTFAITLLLLHGPLAAALLPIRVATLPLLGGVFEAGAATAPADADTPRQTFVFVTGQEFPVVHLMVIRQLESPTTAPRRVAMLASITNHNTVRREDSDTLVITGRGGFLGEPLDQLMRSLDRPFHAGEIAERRDFKAEVRSITPDGRPLEVAFHFRAPLESPEFRWFSWAESGAEGFTPPPVGAEIELPPVPLLPALLASTRARLHARAETGSGS